MQRFLNNLVIVVMCDMQWEVKFMLLLWDASITHKHEKEYNAKETRKDSNKYLFLKNLKILFSMCLHVCVCATTHTRWSRFDRQESVHHEVPRYQMRLSKIDVRHL